MTDSLMFSVMGIFSTLGESEFFEEIQKEIMPRDMKKELWTILNMSLASFKYEDSDEGYERRAVMNYLLKTAAFYNIPKLDDITDKYTDKITGIFWLENVDSYLRNLEKGFISADVHYQDKFMYRIRKFAEQYKKQLVSKQNRIYNFVMDYFDTVEEIHEHRYLISYFAITFHAYQLQGFERIIDRYNQLFSDDQFSQKMTITI